MSDRKITELSLADSTDISSSNAVLHLVNPDRVLDVDKNRKMTLVDNVVLTSGNQTIDGTKTFSSAIAADITGNAATVTDGVYTTGNQTIGGTKTFSSTISGSITGNAGTVTNGVYTSRSISTNNGLTGGGNLSANRTFGLTGQALALHNLATNGVIARTGTGTVAGRTITAGGAITVTNGNGVSGNPTIAHTDTSSQASVNNSGGTVIQDVTLDTYGHVTGLVSYNLDGRYYTESESNARYYQIDYNVNQDRATSSDTINTTLPAMSVGQLQIYTGTWNSSRTGSPSTLWRVYAPAGGTYIWVSGQANFDGMPAFSDTTVAGGGQLAQANWNGSRIVNFMLYRVT